MLYGIISDLDVKIRQATLRALYCPLKALANANWPWQNDPLLAGYDTTALKKELMPGQVGMSRRYHEVTNLYVMGYWKHTCVYVGDGMIAEAVDPVTRLISLDDWVHSKDEICFNIPLDPITEDIMLLAASHSKLIASRAIPYDYEFILDHNYPHLESQYCAEIPYIAYVLSYPNWGFKPRKIWGVETVLPDDYANAKKFFKMTHCIKGK